MKHRLTGLIPQLVLLAVTGVVLLGLFICVLNGYLLFGNAEQSAREQIERNMKVAWHEVLLVGTPLRAEGDRLLAGETALNGNMQVVNNVTAMVGGVATIFLGDRRVASNVKSANMSTVLGSQLASPAARSALFDKGIPYRGEAEILGRIYLTAYDPIRDDRGQVIGALFVGIGKEEFLQPARHSLWLTIAATVAVAVLASLISYAIARRRVVLPLMLHIRAMRHLADGDMAVEVPADGRDDEIGDMAAAFEVFKRNALEHQRLEEEERAAQNLKERLELFEQVFVSNSAIKLLVNPANGEIVDANPAAARFYGYGLETLREMRIFDINMQPVSDTQNRMDSVRRHDMSYFISRHCLADGRLRDVEVHSAPVKLHDRTLLLSIIHDITDRVQGEKALEQAHDQLEQQAKELARSNAELEQFAYVVSHDLRQPLRMVSNYVSLIERRLGATLSDEIKEFIFFARDGALRMDRLILDLLEYSRIGRGQQPLVSEDLGAIISEAIRNLGVAIADRNALISLPDEAPVVWGNRGELVRLFQNLIGNAVKYCPADRRPVISILVSQGCDEIEVAIQDNGIGIAADQTERIFGVFQRLHGGSEYEGTGIGLAICRKIVEHHGGRIWAESDGSGSVFRMVMPIPRNVRVMEDGDATNMALLV